MDETFDISEVIRRTGLTARALRFYEARGLVAPLRTASGRRLYGRGDLARIDAIVALKAAGFSLAEIGRMLGRGPVDLARLIAARIAALDIQAERLADARRLLTLAKSRVDRGEPLDAATLCSLIRTGDMMMTQDDWKPTIDRYFPPDEQARWAETTPPPGTFDQAAYMAQWQALGSKIAARLPLDPAGSEAQALLAEWQALLAPFMAVATPEMRAGAANLYDRMPEWQGDVAPPFPFEVWTFIKEASAARPKA